MIAFIVLLILIGVGCIYKINEVSKTIAVPRSTNLLMVVWVVLAIIVLVLELVH